MGQIGQIKYLKFHRISDVSRGVLFMAEELKIFLQINLEQWEGTVPDYST